MSLLTPTGSGRRSQLPVIAAVVVALALGIGGGWYFAGRDGAKTGTTPSSAPPNCVSKSPSVSGKPAILPLPNKITVNVYNATTRKGLARTTATELAARGFLTGAVANDPLKKVIAGAAEIRAGKAGAGAAKVVAAQVIGAVLVVDARKTAVVDFVIGDAYAALATPAQAAVQLSPSASASAPVC